jgi:agmatinase
VVTEPTPEHDREGPVWRSTGPREADAALLGAPFDGTSGGRPRQAQAPELVRAELGLAGASDEGTRRVWDVGDVLVDPVEPEPTLDALATAVEAAGDRAPSALPVVLGGEHTVSLAAVRALQPASIVSLDAHPDLWDHQHGREIAQGTWLRRAIETTNAEAVLLGSRTARGGEAEAIDELGVREALPTDLPEPVYLTVDVDVVDPEQAPAVVYPEPEGPSAEVVLGWIEQIVGDHELAGVDVVEVNAGRPGPTVELAAAMLDAALAADGGG